MILQSRLEGWGRRELTLGCKVPLSVPGLGRGFKKRFDSLWASTLTSGESQARRQVQGRARVDPPDYSWATGNLVIWGCLRKSIRDVRSRMQGESKGHRKW